MAFRVKILSIQFMLWTESFCYFFRVTVFEAALSSTFWSYLLSKKVFLPLFGAIFIYGQRFLMAVVILSPLYIITLLQFKTDFFSRKTQITISVFFSMPSHDIRKKKSLLIPSSGLSYFYWFLVNLAFQTSPLNWRNECVDETFKVKSFIVSFS